MKDVITEEEEELLWEKGALGCSDAKTLDRSVLYPKSALWYTGMSRAS